MMSRRGSPSVQILIGIAVVGLFLYGFYSYHEVKSRLRSVEEKAANLKNQHESASAQLQVVYEHKTRLEKAIQEEKVQHKKTKDDLTSEKLMLEKRMNQEKDSLTQELDRVKSEKEKAEEDYSRADQEKQQLQDEFKTVQENCQKDQDSHKQLLSQQNQECENDLAQLKDQIADLTRRNTELETKIQNYTHDQKPLGSDLNSANKNKSAQNEEVQNAMQIVQPGDNKPKGYFEVKSPAPGDQNLDAGKQLPPDQKEQVVPPIVKSNDVQVVAPKDNQINDVKQPIDNNLGNVNAVDNNVINPIPIKEEKELVPRQAPAPAANEQQNEPNEPDEQEDEDGQDEDQAQQNPPGQVIKPGQDIKPGQVEVPGQVINPGQVGEQDHLARVADEAEEVDDGQQEQNKGQLQNPAGNNPGNGQGDWNVKEPAKEI